MHSKLQNNLTPPLLQPIKLGRYILNNRIIMAPLTRKRATNDLVPTDIMVTYYEQRASAGLIISEATNISPIAVGYPNSPGIFTKEQILKWSKITNAVHNKGGLIFCQLWHVGRHSHPDIIGGKTPVSASSVKEKGYVTTTNGHQETVIPHELTIKGIKNTLKDYCNAAKNAIEAGFDGVEIHGANGYLIDQFIQDGTNKRTDEYGGTISNRVRFALEVVEEISNSIGSDKTAIRLSPSGTKLDMVDSNPKETFSYLIDKLNDFNLSYLHLLEPWFPVDDLPNYTNHVAEYFRPFYKGNLMANNGFDFESGNAIIKKGNADLVSYGKLFISNPDLPERFAKGTKLTPWDNETFYTSGEKGYIDYPLIK